MEPKQGLAENYGEIERSHVGDLSDIRISGLLSRIPIHTIMDNMPNGSYDIDIEPDDIDVTDTVTVVWEIR